MTTPNTVRPTDDFRENLEWEVLRRHRRNARRRASRPVGRSQFAKVAVIVIVSAAVGASAGYASAQVRQGGARDSLLAAARVDALFATTRLDIAKAQADDVQLKFRMGAAVEDAVNAATAELRDMDARRNTAALNIEEISASGLAPRNDLGAPLVGGRDYVKQRIAVQLSALQAKLTAAEATEANAERGFRMGAWGESVVINAHLNAHLNVVQARGQLSVLAEQMKLRDEFLAKGTPAAQLVQRLAAAQLRADTAYSQAALTAARARLAIVEKQHGVGAANDVDLSRAQLAVKELEAEAPRLAGRLHTVE